MLSFPSAQSGLRGDFLPAENSDHRSNSPGRSLKALRKMGLLEEVNDKTEKFCLASFMKALGLIAMGIIAFFVAFSIFLIQSDRPYAIQIFTLLCYTALTALHIFLRSKLGRGFSPSNPAVKKQLPRLLGIHSAFSIVIFSAQTYVLHIWSRLPVSWTAEIGPKHDSWIELGLIVLFVLTWMAEVLICRTILSRSVDAENLGNEDRA